ncbi:MAG: hypothetical protein IPO01_02440 [Chitinophagaceae bacterium]|nr:hypothetical protein [Chitinophagaceae bacterium]MBK8786395.1 hypothetical protein [Chitinophagaceae bacterium]MBK9484104.1 hypothetical protein [Chitinophagaceae bacterium]
MAINKNHEFEELDGVKCGIVEKNVPPARVEFLKKILEYNKFTVVVVPSPPPKVAAAPVAKVAEGEEAPPPPPPPAPETFTVGVTDYTYNTINAIYGRLLKTPDGHVVTMAYWHQKEAVSHDEIPYYEDVS